MVTVIERRKEIVTKMLGHALNECKKIGTDKVLIVCDKEDRIFVKNMTTMVRFYRDLLEFKNEIEMKKWNRKE